MCGIFGFSSKNNTEKFQVDKLSILGMYNDSRGKDSCGLFIDKHIKWGVDKQKLFADFICLDDMLSSYENKHVDIAVGHCRKASVGKISLETAQPIIIYGEDEQIEFVFTHNGTLLNHQDLSKKYLSKVPDHFTDSQILAWIIYFRGPKVLTEYNGAGAFAWVDYREGTPKTYLFKGASPNYQYGTVVTEERPLFITETDNGIWWSSMQSSLEVITYGKTKVIDINPNTLFCIEQGKIISSKVYDRKNNYQLNTSYYSKGYYNRANTNKNSIVWKTIPCYEFDPYKPEKYAGDKLYFKDGLYYHKDNIATGIFKAYSTGYICNSDYGNFKTFYIFKGYLLDSLYSYCIACRMEETLKEGEKFKLTWLAPLCYNKIYYDLELNRFYEVTSYTSYTKRLTAYKGEYPILFQSSPIIYNIRKGKIVGKKFTEARWTDWTPFTDYTPVLDMDCYVKEAESLSKYDINVLLDVEIEDIKNIY